MESIFTFSIKELVDRSDACIRAALDEHLSVHVISPSATWAMQRKLMLARKATSGVTVQTYSQWLEGAWDLFGDGRLLIKPAQRRALLRLLLHEFSLLDSKPSVGLVDFLATFVPDALSVTDTKTEGLTSSETKLVALVDAYSEKLDGLGLVEEAYVEDHLPLDAMSCAAFVVENPSRSCVHEQRFFKRLGAHASVVLFERRLDAFDEGAAGKGWATEDAAGEASAGEGADVGAGATGAGGEGEPDASELSSLRSMLFSGRSGLMPQGSVVAGLSFGHHARPYLLAKMIERFVSQGAMPSDIAVVFKDSSDAYPHMLHALEMAEIPYQARISIPLAQIGLGAAFCDLIRFADSCEADSSKADSRIADSSDADSREADPSTPDTFDDKDCYESLMSFLESPYCGIDAADARALCARWRSLAGSTAADRLNDIRKGFDSGIATSSQVAQALQPLAELIDADDTSRVALLFEHATGSFASDKLVNSLRSADDRAACNVLLGYIETNKALGIGIDVEDIAALPVPIERSFVADELDGAVELCCAEDLSCCHKPYVILADLDVEHYPMARKETPLDALREKLGIAVDDDAASEQRLLLLDAIEVAETGFGFFRSSIDADGKPSCQSALFDELMACYRSSEENASGLDPAALPAVLEPFAIKVSESEEFFEGSMSAAPALPAAHGILTETGSLDLLTANLDGTPRDFSPTQIEDYYRCPYRWFISRRIGYTSIDRVFDQSALGTLFHDVMARFYPALKKAGHARVEPENLDEACAIAAQSFDEQVAESRNHPGKGLFVLSGADLLELDALKEKVIAFVERDAYFLPGFVPAYFEVRLAGRDCALEYATVLVHGAVDRIDIDDRGRAVVIDYKFSSLTSDYGLSRKFADPFIAPHVQADIYATLVEKHFALQGKPLQVVGSVYRSYSANKLRGVYAAGLDFGSIEQTCPSSDALPGESLQEDYAHYLARVEDAMTSCMGRLATGEIAPDPLSDDVCKYCKAQPFCPTTAV